jgi:hypothetical protein
MRRTLLVAAAVVAGALAMVAGPALSAKSYRPAPVDFELSAPPAKPTIARAGREYVSPPLRAPKRFNLVGLRWTGPAASGTHLRVRVREDGGRWTPWTELGSDSADGPDPRTGERVAGGMSAPAWAGQADWVQYRSERPLPGARLHFVNTTGTATAADRRLTALRRVVNGGVMAMAGLTDALSSEAHAAQAQPAMVSRAGWGAQDCPPRAAPSYGSVKMAFVHHTVNLNDYSRAEAPSIVLAICRYHRNSNGWNDIGYNFLVDKYGTIYEGRAGGIDRPVIGAQAQGYNAESTGIANIGTFDSVPQTNEAMDAMARLIRWKLPLSGAPTAGRVTVTSAGGASNRYPAGTPVTFERISGHRDGDSTDCPGAALYAQLPDLRARVGNVQPGGGGGAGPAGTRVAAASTAVSTVYPVPAQIAGTLRTVSDGAVADAPVELQRQGSDGEWRTVARGTTDGSGGFALPIAPSFRAVVRVFYPGDAGHRSSTSRPTTVLVRPALSVHKPSPRMRPGGLLTVTGTIAPRKHAVQLIVERRSGAGRKGRVDWRRWPARTGRYTARVRLRTAGLYRVYVLFPGDSKNLPVAGQPFFVRVAPGVGGTTAPKRR